MAILFGLYLSDRAQITNKQFRVIKLVFSIPGLVALWFVSKDVRKRRGIGSVKDL